MADRNKIQVAYDRFFMGLYEDPDLQSQGYQIIKTYWRGSQFHILLNMVPNCILKDLLNCCFYGTYGKMVFSSSLIILE